jgi:hypothetical protein
MVNVFSPVQVTGGVGVGAVRIAHFLVALAFIHHLHHVTRNADADASAETHSIEDELLCRRVVLAITRRCSCVPALRNRNNTGYIEDVAYWRSRRADIAFRLLAAAKMIHLPAAWPILLRHTPAP